MESSTPKRILIVAHKTAATPSLLDAVAQRAAQGPCQFTLVVPAAAHGLQRVVDPEDADRGEAEAVLERALPLLEEAAGGPVQGIIGAPAALTAVMDAVNAYGFDEVIVSTLPAHISKWLHLDLPSKIGGLGLPVTTVTAKERAKVALE